MAMWPDERRQRRFVEDVVHVTHLPHRRAPACRRPKQCRRFPGRDAGASRGRGTPASTLRHDRRCRRPRTLRGTCRTCHFGRPGQSRLHRVPCRSSSARSPWPTPARRPSTTAVDRTPGRPPSTANSIAAGRADHRGRNAGRLGGSDHGRRAALGRRHHDARRRLAEQGGIRPAKAPAAPVASQVHGDADAAAVERAFGERDGEARLPRNRAPIRRAPSRIKLTIRFCKRRSRARSSAGGAPRTLPCMRRQVLAATDLASIIAQQHDRRAGPFEGARHRCARIVEQPDDAEHRRRVRWPGLRFRCRG